MCRNIDLRFFFLLSSVKVFFLPFFAFFLSVLLSFLLLSNWFFYRPSFSPFFFDIVLFLFFLTWFGTKSLGCCCYISKQNRFLFNNLDFFSENTQPVRLGCMDSFIQVAFVCTCLGQAIAYLLATGEWDYALINCQSTFFSWCSYSANISYTMIAW
jgi:energy-coupling factor transporter transmembrane protein EcfT